MRASLFCLMVAAGWAAGCTQESTPESGEGTSKVTSQATEHEEFVCNLHDGRVVEIYPSNSELHRIDLNMGTWSMDDGLTIEVTPWVVSITDEEGGSVASIDKHGSYYAEEDGKPVTGTCDRFFVETLKPTSAPLTIDDALAYSCTTKEGDVELVVRPAFGEIDMIRVNDGRFYSLDGMKFEAKAIETSPAKNELSAKDDNGTVTTIVESDSGITIQRAEISGTCEKLQRRPL